MCVFVPPGPCWQPDLPDNRDYTVEHWLVQKMLSRLDNPSESSDETPRSVDLREYFNPVRDAQKLKSSAAHACVALLEYFERRALGRLNPSSVRFVYKTAQRLMHRRGGAGAELRATLRAMVRFGVPPLQYCPDDVELFDKEPEPFLFSFANESRSMVYVRLDDRNTSGTESLHALKAFLAAGFPCVFGFSVPASLSWEPDIPWRPQYDSVWGGQAVVAVGYDNRRLAGTKGAILIRSCWGTRWGEHGYGWLPYQYVTEQLARDIWTLLDESWLDSGEFKPVLRYLSSDSVRQD